MAQSAVEYFPRALEDLAGLSAEVALSISAKLWELALDPRPRGDTIRRLTGFEIPTFRLRIGDYRAVFRVDPGVVHVLRITHRSQLDRVLRGIR